MLTKSVWPPTVGLERRKSSAPSPAAFGLAVRPLADDYAARQLFGAGFVGPDSRDLADGVPRVKELGRAVARVVRVVWRWCVVVEGDVAGGIGCGDCRGIGTEHRVLHVVCRAGGANA